MGARQHTYQRILVRACEIVGDEIALAKALGVPVVWVVDWVLGDAHVPTEIFLRAVDIVLDSAKKEMHTVDIVFDSTKKQVQEQQRQTEEMRPVLEQIRQRHRMT